MISAAAVVGMWLRQEAQMAGTAAEPAGTAAAAAAAETAGPDTRAEHHSVAGPGRQARLHGQFCSVMQVRHQACK